MASYERVALSDIDPSHDRDTYPPPPPPPAPAHDHDRDKEEPLLRPAIYYGDGPFTAPSSVDGDEVKEPLDDGDGTGVPEEGITEGDGLLGKEREPDEERGGVRRPLPDRPRSPLRWLIISLTALLLTSALIGALAATSYKPSSPLAGRKPLTLDHIFNGTFSARSKSLDWVPEAGDGVYSETNEKGDIVLVDLSSNASRVLLERGNVKDPNGRPLSVNGWKLSPDMRYILLKTDYKKQWRHSSFGNYWIHSLSDNSTRALVTPSYPPITAYATWSPTGNSLAYVHASDLYVLPHPSPLTQPIRVTYDGNSSVFNGVPDWVYEEEVFSGESALWWSPDSRRIAFLRSDETKVDEYVFPVYNPTGDAATVEPYTGFTRMKYPKPGYANPLVTALLFDLSNYDSIFPDDTTSIYTLPFPESTTLAPPDRVIQEVVWVGNTSLLIKTVNRAADNGSVVLFDVASTDGRLPEGKVVRVLGGEGGEWADGGWIDPEQRIVSLAGVNGYPKTAYLDVLPTEAGYNHLVLFTGAEESTPRYLTSGLWEVTGAGIKVDTGRGVLYFQAAAPTSTERHVYSVLLPPASLLSSLPTTPSASTNITGSPPSALTDIARPGTFSASFSPKCGWYVLSCQGPEVPWQEVRKVGDQAFKVVLEDNRALNETSADYAMPVVVHGTIEIDGYEMNTIELRPPGMDDSGRVKYPVLFRVYGGPFSQTVSYSFTRDWHHYLATGLRYIIVTIDGRGTGFRGRSLRNPVRGHLGEWETHDQIEAARQWVGRGYVDTRRVGIWGWSYGGFMSCKVIEADQGIHTLAMAVAPVTDWRMYDSIYTERYMLTPQTNLEGYVNSSITRAEPFGKVDFLLAHGSGDDNVHFANSAHLVDLLTQRKVRGWRFRMFTDSDHSIAARGANRELYEWMTAFLVEKWGRGGVTRV